MRCVRLRHLSRNLFNLFDRTWRFECNKANVALLQMCRSLSNKLEAGLNTRLTKTLRGESLIPWWICAVRSTTDLEIRSISLLYRATVSMCPPCIYIYNNIYIITLSPDFCRQSSTHTRALTRTYMYVVAWSQAGEHTERWQWYLTTHTYAQQSYTFCILFFLCLSKVPPTRLDKRIEFWFSRAF